MPFEHYKDALIEAAASGAEPEGELRAHLEACDSCRAVFAEEQTLFASIDAGLHAKVNTEVPTSLLPRVRARLDEASAPQRSWPLNWFVLAGATAVIAAFLVASVAWRPHVEQNLPTNSARSNPSTPVFSPPPQDHAQAPEPSVKNTPFPRPQTFLAKNFKNSGLPAVRDAIPEVLVPRDQEALLAEYAAQWNLHKRAPLVTRDSDATIVAQLQVAPIQIDELGVKLLAEEK